MILEIDPKMKTNGTIELRVVTENMGFLQNCGPKSAEMREARTTDQAPSTGPEM